MMSSFWLVLALLVLLAGLRYLSRVRSLRARMDSRAVDDDAIREIIETGSLPADEEAESLDLDEAARAEEEFWDESWDEPEEYGR